MSMKQMRMRTLVGRLSLAVAVVAASSCGDVVRTGRSPMMLVMNSLSGGTATAAGPLQSDVIRRVTSSCTPGAAPCVLADPGTASLTVVPKDVTVTPTTNNAVTVTRYRVVFHRADGHNVEGVDVPYAFDGATTATINAGATATVGLVLVQSTAKRETPLVQLSSNPEASLATIADVTFYGQDQVGNEISVTGSILINFGDFPG
jgi:hypothetical protein